MSLGLIAILKMSPCLNIAGPILFNRFTEAGPILAALISALYTQIYQPVCTQSPQRKWMMTILSAKSSVTIAAHSDGYLTLLLVFVPHIYLESC